MHKYIHTTLLCAVMNVDLEFFYPKPDDFHGLKILLNNYLDVKVWDLSGFVDLILGQTTVGTVVKPGDDGAPFGVISAINLERYKDHRCIVDLKSFLLDVCHEKSISSQLKIFLGEQAQGVGLLVSQRVVNLPLEILPPLYDSLFDEVSWATEDEISHGGKPNGKGALGENEAEPILYNHLEDEIFDKLCSWSFTFQLRDQQAVTHELRNYRKMGLVMAVKADKQTVDKFREDLKTFISDS
ncbi:protein BCCIP homolog isoform X2 [Amborella trichopoda]|uniref:protein BCCIP homolog isoform X2 n=1 Tax=Amborella trichopoda TaxID=13333 RepID=UPI0009C145A7|nr:protein BCCIP homolog isoform X2 [Amborella trichopoda]XP_020530221.1 protein BCCIP homolog isoform X2 [Amborella trichopoda]|eukprot:XP_020530217.1 protein BCCIP homolog isoform X2 [Amborella trichopoda]